MSKRSFLLGLCLMASFWMQTAWGQIAKTNAGFSIAIKNLQLELDQHGNLCWLTENIGPTASEKVREGFAVTDGKTQQALTPWPGLDGKIEGQRLVFTGADAAQKLDVKLVFAPVKEHLSCKISLKNTGTEQRWLYVKYALPMLYRQAGAYWNGAVVFNSLDDLNICKRIGSGFPMSCIYGAKSGVALGIEGHQLFSWLDTGVNTADQSNFYWAAKMVLDPGQEDSVEFILYAFKNDYGYLNALDLYYKAFPDLFVPAPGIDPRAVYGNCASGYGTWGFILDYDHTPQRELLRRSFSTWEWMYAPFKRAGDIYGREEYWNWGNKVADENGNFKGTAAEYRGRRVTFFNRADKYGVASMFYFINWVEEQMSKDVFPGTMINDPDTPNRIDAWVHTYHATTRNYMWGNKFAENTKADLLKLTQEPFRCLSGFALDCAEGTARHRGEGMNQSPGRAYDNDGVYVSETIGEALMIDYVHTLKAYGRTMAIVPNIAAGLYTVSFRADTTIAEKSATEYLTNIKQAQADQYLMGKKPRCIYQINFYKGTLGDQIDWKQMSKEQLKDFYRALYKSIVLLGFKCNMFYAADLAVGSKNIVKSMPARIELCQTGFEVIPAAKAGAEMWVSRYGQDALTFLFVGNPGNKPQTGALTTDNPYLGDSQYVFTTYAGQETENKIANNQTVLAYTLEPKDYAVFKCVLALQTKAPFSAKAAELQACDRQTVKIQIAGLNEKSAARVRIPVDMQADALRINGQAAAFRAEAGTLAFEVPPAPETAIELDFRSLWVVSPEKALLDFPVFGEDQESKCTLVLAENAAEYDRENAWYIQTYFRTYCMQIKEFKVKIPLKGLNEIVDLRDAILIGGQEILPKVKTLAPGIEAELAAHPRGLIKVLDKNVLLIYAESDADRRQLIDRLLRIWDKKYIYYGNYTLELLKLGTQAQSPATKAMQKKAGVEGKVIDE